MLDTYELLDATTDLHAYGLSIRTAAQLDLPLLDHEDAGVIFDTDERTMYRAPSCPIYVSDDPSDELPGYSPDRTDPTLIAEELEADEEATILTWLHRCAVTDADIAAYILDPEANMTEQQKAVRAEARAEWRASQLRLRKVQLHAALREWFGVSDYRPCTVTVWIEDATKPKGVRPQQVNVLAWIASRVEEKGDELAGIASCAALMRQRIARRRPAAERGA